MQFLVTIKIHDAIVLDGDKRVREVIGPQIQHILESGKGQGGGFLGDMRGGFFVLDINAAEELYETLGPELFSTCTVEAHPIIPWQKGAALFQQWGAAGR
ncbi:MAG TPA: hypothetical protein VHB98_01945 [Chloroflexota bacterium]|jgi:hypothetical protein|nr:hypothetical protein [Chloroflexota bacterium]